MTTREPWPPICPDCGQAMFALAGREYHCLQQEMRMKKEAKPIDQHLPATAPAKEVEVVGFIASDRVQLLKTDDAIWMTVRGLYDPEDGDIPLILLSAHTAVVDAMEKTIVELIDKCEKLGGHRG